MPSVSSGKYIVKSVKVYKDHVTVFFTKRENIKISKEAYLSSYLYEGKSISKKEIDKLIEITAFSTLLNYALSLISKRHYSQRKMFEKLKAKEDNYQAINNVIDKLKENDLIDDKAFMEDLIAWDDERLFGKNKIIKHLKDQGIPDNILSKAHFSHSNELKKAKGLIPKLEKKYARYGHENMKQHIYNSLLNQGFEYDVAKVALNNVKAPKIKEERVKIKNDFIKIKNRYIKKYDGYELKQKIYAALAAKGYKHTEIKLVLEEYSNENDF